MIISFGLKSGQIWTPHLGFTTYILYEEWLKSEEYKEKVLYPYNLKYYGVWNLDSYIKLWNT